MSDLAKDTLKKLIKENGESLYLEISRLKGLLYDTCPSCRKEINILILAAQEGLIAELKKVGISDVHIHALSGRLYNVTGIDKALAEWSIKAWAEALGLGIPSSTLYCSFCGKSQHEVSKLITGATAIICNECTELCMKIVREETEQNSSSCCSFCGKSQKEVNWLVSGLNIARLTVSICNECTELCMKIVRERRLEEKLIYRSDFYFPSKEWREIQSDYVRIFRQDGYYHIALHRSDWCKYCWPSIPIGDFRVHVDAEFAANSGGTAECGVVFRLRTDNNESSYYRFSISRSGHYTLDVRVKGSFKPIVNRIFSEFIRRNDADTNSLTVEMVGQRISLGVNGNILATATDGRLTCGNVGLHVSTGVEDSFSEVKFRDFRLYSI